MPTSRWGEAIAEQAGRAAEAFRRYQAAWLELPEEQREAIERIRQEDISAVPLDSNEGEAHHDPMPASTNYRNYPRLGTAERNAVQDRCYSLRQQGMSYAQIASIIGETAARANAHVRDAVARQVQLGNRCFGVEIELKGLSQLAAARALTNAGITAYDENYNHVARPHWKVVPDGSISGGCEVVSPILSGQEGLEQLAAAMAALRSAGATVDQACGMHVHIDARDLTGDEFARTFAFYTERQELMDLLVAPSRRHNTYCRKYDERTIVNIKDTAKQDTDRYGDTVDGKRQATRVHGDRYMTVNLQSYLTHGTLEFRQHQGTLNGTKAVSWVTMLLAIATKVQATAEEEISRTDVGAMLDGLGMGASVTNYLKARAARLTP